MNHKFLGYAEGVGIWIMGAAVFATEAFDLISRTIGLMAVMVGMFVTLTRWNWDREDRLEKKRGSASIPLIRPAKIYIPEPRETLG